MFVVVATIYHKVISFYVAGYQIGFTAQGSVLQPSGVVRFSYIKSNIGSRYSSSTGQFTCDYPGLYYFSVSLIKLRTDHSNADMVNCYIRKNSLNLINTKTDPRDDDTDNGSYETSAFLVIHLSSGDTVDVGGCSSTKLESQSSFTGFLLKTD